tara:strand:- start:580 stop:3042 length:2463 start_codon:yes stop_codon:yes gene_type:complete
VKLIRKLFVATFAASFSLPIYSQINKGFMDKDPNKASKNILLAENPGDDDSGTLKIFVTGTRTPREVQNVPASVNLIEQDEIIRKGISDLKDLFKYDAAVNIKSESASRFSNYGQGEVSIRGFSNNRILMQRDSIRLPAVYKFDTAYTIYRAEMVDLNSLKGTEILKGAASSLYGSDALGGVITYQSLFPEDILADDETIKIQTNNTFNTSNSGIESTVKIAARDDDSDLEGVVVVTTTGANEMQTKGDAKYRDDLKSNGINFYTNLVKNIDDNSRINFIFENVDKRNDTIVASDNLSSSYEAISQERDLERSLVSLNYEYDNNEGDKFFDYVKVGGYIQKAYSVDNSKVTRAAGYDPGASNPLYDSDQDPDGDGKDITGRSKYGILYFSTRNQLNNYDLKDDSIGANIQIRNDIDEEINHRLTFGVDFSVTENERTRKKYDSQGLGSADPFGRLATTVFKFPSNKIVKDSPDSKTTLVGVYLQDEISFDNNKWEIIPGIRFDYYDLDSTVDDSYLQSEKSSDPIDINEDVINPSIALLYKANENLTIYGKYNGGFRAPQYSEINSTYGNLAYNYYIVSNPDLKSETSTNYEIGINGNYDKLNFSLNGFWSNFDNRIDGYEEVSSTSSLYDKGPDGLLQSSSCGRGDTEKEGRACDDLSVYQFVNKDKAEIYGLELSSSYNFNSEPSGFTLFNSLAYTIGNDTSTSDYTPLLSIDPFKAITGLNYKSKDQKWNTDFIATYTGIAKTSSSNTNFVPDAHTIFDFIGSYKSNDRLTFDLGIYNLLDKKYFNFSTVKNEGDDASIDRFAEPGRYVKVGFNFIF